jgi:capsular polysaccharide biosynthesis protein
LRDSGVRNLLNGENLLKIAVEEGFDGINPYELSFTQQVNLIYHAKQIILTGGASMANLMFAKPGTNIL